MVLKIVGLIIAAIVLTAIVLHLLNPLPPLEPRLTSSAIEDTADTPLGHGVRSAMAGHPGQSGVHLLDDGREAFAARALLARAATRSLDVQYYIWHGDRSGTLMLEEMHAAADRGVRVRMLLDDNGISGLDAPLAALASHPGIEVRLFNPFVLRWPKMIGYLTDFHRLNRRMHNKSFTADNQVTIIGGRNIGDEYFDARDDGLFADLDVLAIGPVVEDVSRDFDRYWASASAYPVEKLLDGVGPEQLAAIEAAASIVERDPAARAYVEAVRSLPFIHQLLSAALPFHWAPVRMVSDDPEKGLGRHHPTETLLAALLEIIGKPQSELGLVSGYFVPTAAGVEAFTDLAREGVQVTILTNALEANDVGIVHAGYAGWRKTLLKAGVRLYEMRGQPVEGGRRAIKFAGLGWGSGSGAVVASSASTLHAKTFTVDRQRLFVGSFNFDPRSMHLNTELGFVIESPALAGMIQDAFDKGIPERAYAVRLTESDRLVWIERDGSREIRHDTEPGTTRLQRIGVRVLSWLPIEWLL